MGLNSVVVVHHDKLDNIRTSPDEFARNLCSALDNTKAPQRTVAAGGCKDVANVVTTHRNDMVAVCAVGADKGSVIAQVLAPGVDKKEDQITILQKAAKHLGYKLVKE